jgi:hypothetical protein
MHPAFVALKPLPPKRLAEEQQARMSKGLAAMTRAAKLGGSAKPKPKKRTARSKVSASPISAEDHGDPDDDYQPPGTAADSMCNTRKRKLIEKSGSDTVETPSKKAKTRGADRQFPRLEVQQTATEDTIDPDPVQTQAGSISTASHLDGGSTVVVGAGIIGLAVARELALEARKLGIDHHTMVVDIRGGPCELASRHCVGILSAAGVAEDWNSLAQSANEAWFEMLSQPDVTQAVSFSTKRLTNVTDNGRLNQERCPSWLKGGEDCSFSEDSSAIGRM